MKNKKNTDLWAASSLLVLWVAGVVISFLIMAPDDALGWGLLSFYIALPLVSLLSTVILHRRSWKFLVMWSAVCGALGYLVFALPAGDFDEIIFFALGCVPALAAAGIISVYKALRHKNKS